MTEGHCSAGRLADVSVNGGESVPRPMKSSYRGAPPAGRRPSRLAANSLSTKSVPARKSRSIAAPEHLSVWQRWQLPWQLATRQLSHQSPARELLLRIATRHLARPSEVQ